MATYQSIMDGWRSANHPCLSKFSSDIDPENSKLILADYWEEKNRKDIADILLDRLPHNGEGRRDRISSLSDKDKEQFDPWAKKWIQIGQQTGPADRALFETAARACYRLSGLQEPEKIIWVPCPMVACLA